MTCSVCNVKGHNKRRCPNKDTAVSNELAPKRSKGRPRIDGQPPHPKDSSAASASTYHPINQPSSAQPAHQTVLAQPSQLGRGGRTIRGGRGSRGGNAGRGRGRGQGRRRGRNQVLSFYNGFTRDISNQYR